MILTLTLRSTLKPSIGVGAPCCKGAWGDGIHVAQVAALDRHRPQPAQAELQLVR